MKGFAVRALHTGRRLLGPAWLTIDAGRVVDVGEGTAPSPGFVELQGTLVPGLVDMHCHGRWNISFDRDSRRDVASMAARCWGHGVTSTMATVATAPLDVLKDRLADLAPLVRDGILAGIHLEGPYLAPSRRGAHVESLLRRPDVAEIAALLDVADGAVRMVTIAPELPAALDVVRHLVSRGVVVALGHSDATEDEARRAIDAGASVATHLFNGMRPLGHRDPGIAGACLLDARVTLEVIADGQHVHPAVVEIVQRVAQDRVAFVSDSILATGASDGRYELAGGVIDVVGGVAVAASSGSLAGSTTPLDAVLSDGWPDAIDHLDSYTSVPADALRLEDVGTLEAGRYADLVLIDDSGHRRAMRRGEWLTATGDPSEDQ